MALPRGGEISMSQINVELGRSATALIGLDDAENGAYGAINTNSAARPDAANPASMSEWYGYNHTAGPAFSCTFNAGTSVSVGLFSVRGIVSIVGIPGVLTLCAFGGASSRSSTDAYLDIDGNVFIAVFAGPFTEQCSSGNELGPANYSYRLYAFFNGTSGNSANVTCAQ